MTHWRGSNDPLLNPTSIQFWTAVLVFSALFCLYFLAGVAGGLQASEQARFSLSVAGDHLHSAWECAIYALQVW